MKKIISIITVLFATLIMSGCGAAKLTPAQQAVVDSQATMYTQVSMWTERNRIIGTNYALGMHIPVNSEVKILDMNAKVIVFEYQGQKIKYEVYTKYTRVDAGTMLDRLFSKTKVNLSTHSAAIKESIEKGLVTKDMTKDEVLLARGYPPFHATQGIEANTWKYWRHRFATALVTFQDGKVSEIKGVPSE